MNDKFTANDLPDADDIFGSADAPTPVSSNVSAEKYSDGTDSIDYEKLSYGKFAYKRVQRLRRKGKHRGIEVPVLRYALTKPDKPRIAFWIVAIVSAVLLIGIMVGIGFLYNELIKTFSIFDDMGDVFKAVLDPSAFALSAGLSAIPAMMIFLAYLLLILMFILPVVAIIYMYRFVRDSVYMAKCSKEEFAKGNIVSSRIMWLIIALAVSTVILIVIVANVSDGTALLLSGLIYGGIVVVLGGFLALTIVEKVKCSKWFDTFDEDKKQNYLAHERALRRVKSRLSREKRMWSDL